MNDMPSNERILAALRDARQKLEDIERARNERIAVIGLAGRFPGADDIDAFWSLLAEGRRGVREVSEDELRAAGVPESLWTREDYVRAWAGFDRPDAFDAGFFGYSPREAELMDPQQRVFLECAWHALEDAGIDSSRERRAIGVYAGAALNSYVINLHSDPQLRDSVDAVQAVVSNVLGLMVTRASYHLNLNGPSIGVQTGCSSSLVAVHTACRSLLARECDIALAGGVTVASAQPQGYLYQPGGIASPDGRCRAFDAHGQGTVFGNGVGLVVLKRLSDAIADGDCIRAVILGSAINNDGADKVGLIAPSVSGQAAVIRAALDAAGIDPATLDYIEAHGTGTDLGDPIEVAALNRVLKPAFAQRAGEIALGSVKSNVGHLDAAAGIAGLIKTVLALQHGVLPASLDHDTPNPAIDFASGPLRVNRARRDWPARTGERAGTPRRAAVSSFGMGGTNAHAILQQAPDAPVLSPLPARRWQILPWSARTASALDTLGQRLAHRLHTGTDPVAAAGTLQRGRRAMPLRRAAVCADAHEAVEAMNAGDGLRRFSGEAAAGGRPAGFLFSGQGSQRVGMAAALYREEPVFRDAIDACAAVLEAEFDLRALLWPDADGEHAEQRLRQTAHAQPALFAVEYALARLWMSWGIQPQVMAGHSVGEYVAACLAGVFRLADALALVKRRGELMQRCAPGSMLAVMQDEATLRAALPPDLDIALVNGPRQCVVGGTLQAVEAFADACAACGVPTQPLATSHAFHTAMMEPALDDFRAAVDAVTRSAPLLDIVSTLTGRALTAAEATSSDYWVRQLRQTVRFGDALATLAARRDLLLIEVGPGDVLARLAQQQGARDAIASLPAGDAALDMACALARAWVAGVDIDWTAYAQGRPQQRCPLPGYPFERQRYWVALRQGATERAGSADDASGSVPAALPDMKDWFHVPGWRADAPAVVARSPLALRVDGEAALCAALSSQPGIDTHTGDAAHTVWICPDLAAPAAFDALLALLRALPRDGAPHLLSVVTRGAWSLGGEAAARPEHAVLTGLLQVAAQEVPGLRTRQIDIDDTDDAALADLADALRQPWALDARIVMLRGGTRWLRDWQPLPLDEAAPALRHEGCYLVIGDLLEGLAMVIARGLHRSARARIVLVGQPGLPMQETWEHWLATHGPRHPASVLIRTLQGLKQEGAQFALFSGDITHAAWLDDVLAGAQARFGALCGAFHVEAMGDQAGCSLADTDEAERRRTLDARIDALRALAASPRLSDIDFVLLQSSLSSVVGGAGFAAYAAASSLADAFALQHRAGAPWVALNWDAVERDVLAREQGTSPSALLADAIGIDETWQAVERVLGHARARRRSAQVVLTPKSLDARLRQAFEVAPDVPTRHAGGSHSRPDIATPYVEPRTDTERMVATAMGELLGIARVGADDDFFELGGHSLLAIQAVTRLRKEFGVELPMRALLFEARTVAGIAAVIDRSRAAAAAAAAATATGTGTGDAEVDALLGDIDALHAAGGTHSHKE
ncbi:type I polyketide synthase [Methyloversatilis thermotolerans]|uniref:type I polyketide synthase n=1 Tax=Methyloversatilis thermotolerans TaxID=1346290 RepID=UPI000380D4F2|nr:type I polyketide synthase [Methyloversatilis thermotolerans]